MKNKRLQKIVISTSVILLLILFAGCSGIQGYGVLLWSVPEHGLSDGDVVPVYLRSNIGKIYAIGVPGTKTKIEVPLWQITEPESKRKATKRAELLLEYKYQYASVKIDGLAIRSDAVNTADQIYRLRENETIKILYKGEGQPVMRGSTPLEGDWMRVLTSDGTEGWCFSYNLNLYDEREGIKVEVVDNNGASDEIIQTISQKKWYPEYYSSMINENKVDLQRIRFDYGFDIGLVSGLISVANENLYRTYPFIGITRETSNKYSLDDTPLSITIHSENYVTVEYVDEIGRRVGYGFVAFSTTATNAENEEVDYIEHIISQETERRNNQYLEILNVSEVFSSSNYGTITFSRNDTGTFTWRGFQRLVNAGLNGFPTSGGALARGNAEINYFIDDSMANEFDGVITLRFDTTSEELNLLYKMEATGIRFESVDNAAIDKGTVTERSSNPIVMFFNK